MPSTHARAPDIDAAAVKQAVSILDVAQGYGIALKRAGREYVGLSPFKAERSPSFYVDPDKGLFKCFASNEGGDVIHLVMLMDRCSFREALARLADGAGISGDPERQRQLAEAHQRRAAELRDKEAEDKQRLAGIAAHLLKQSKRAEGTLVEEYLNWRNIDLDALERVYGWRVPPMLRFHPRLGCLDEDVRQTYWPAMVGGCYVEVNGCWRFRGLHRTYLSPDGRGKAPLGKAKKALGAMWGATTRLSKPGPVAVVGEGYETVLSVMAAMARDGEMVFGVSALSLGNLAGAGTWGASRAPICPECGGRAASPHPDTQHQGLMLPEMVREVLILKDADGKCQTHNDAFMRRAATKFQRAGKSVRIAIPEMGKDFNDMIRERTEPGRAPGAHGAMLADRDRTGVAQVGTQPARMRWLKEKEVA